MKEQDAAHSFEKRYKNKPDVIRIIDNLNAENADLKAELTRLRSELQQKDESIKELCHILEGITQIHFENGSRPSKRDIERIKSLIEKVKSNILK